MSLPICLLMAQSDSAQNMNHTDPEECFEGDDEMEDLLFHFGNYYYIPANKVWLVGT